MKLSQLIAEHKPKRKWLEITWKQVKFLWWTIPWIDKAYVFGKRFHHLELGLILIFVGWLLVIHDWFVHERPKVTGPVPPIHPNCRCEIKGVSIEFEAKERVRLEDGTVTFRDARIRRIRPIRVPRPGSKVGQLKSRFFKPRPAFEKRLWREGVKPEEVKPSGRRKKKAWT